MDFPFAREAISKLFSKSSCNMSPAVPSEAAQNYRGRIAYRADKCIGCGMCERVCAGNAISRTVEKTEEGDKITLTFNLGSCTFCATCAYFCSRKAIELTGDYHMIATKEEDLLVTGSFIKKPPVKKAAPAPAALPTARALAAKPAGNRPIRSAETGSMRLPKPPATTSSAIASGLCPNRRSAALPMISGLVETPTVKTDGTLMRMFCLQSALSRFTAIWRGRSEM